VIIKNNDNVTIAVFNLYSGSTITIEHLEDRLKATYDNEDTTKIYYIKETRKDTGMFMNTKRDY